MKEREGGAMGIYFGLLCVQMYMYMYLFVINGKFLQGNMSAKFFKLGASRARLDAYVGLIKTLGICCTGNDRVYDVSF